MAVEAKLGPILKAARRSEYNDLRLRLTLRGRRKDQPDVDEVAALVRTAIDRVGSRYGEDLGYATTYAGSHGVQINVEHGEEPPELTGWVTDIAGELTDLGLTGVLSVATSRSPDTHSYVRPVYRPTALVYYSFENPRLTHDWLVPEPVSTMVFGHAATWLAQPGHTVYISEDLFCDTYPARDAAGVLRRARQHTSLCGMYGVPADAAPPNVTTCVTFGSGCCVGYQVYGLDLPGQLDAVTQTMLLAPDAIDYAAVTAANYGSQTVPQERAWDGDPTRPISGPSYGHHRRFFADRTPDAFPVQVLTAAHLERANDLSRWDVRQITDRRWLVTHPDPEAFFPPPPPGPGVPRITPDPDLIAAARNDFGELILTDGEAIAELTRLVDAGITDV